ncbi:MAG: prolyl oligopeptidase family serine peptidase [Oligoflexia bacterium]|nr:prolyl oligopeptidase family serine peptidase [Oligoflexia bacterium]
MKKNAATFGVLALISCLAACSSLLKRKPASELAAENDPHLWLEEVESEAALSWARAQNERSLPQLSQHPRFAQLEGELRKIVTAKDRIPYPSLSGDGWVYNFWQDAKNIKGLWRRTRLAEYSKKSPRWETILDLDALSRQENESWVWDGADCLPPEYERCLITLSRGGKDASVVREFDLARREFIPLEKGGFHVPEAKSRVSWLDRDTLFVGTDFGPGTLTDAGYPRQVRLWKRGAPLQDAKLVFEGEKADVSSFGYASFAPEGTTYFVTRNPSFFEEENFLLEPSADRTQAKLLKLPFPRDAELQVLFKGLLIAKLRTEWKTPGRAFPEGSLVSLAMDRLADADPIASVQVLFRPHARASIEQVSRTKNHLYLKVLDNVRSRVLEAVRDESEWHYEHLELPDNGTISLVSATKFDDRFFVSFQSFLTPTSILLVDGQSARKPKVVKSLPARFNPEGLMIEQLEAVSADGTKIPYFVVRPKNLAFDGKAPTILYGYGGFEISSVPYYSGGIGKTWLEKGGVYVLANIRGGGEFGPRWHQAALKTQRQRSFDDFIAVAEDLARRMITSPDRLGIWGGSNGGLLVGATFVQRPELFRAVMCEVPLLDMLRYHKLLAGSSWMGEYGDPEDPVMAEAIQKYSPYQNVKTGARYPKVFFFTSTRDDRVHPAHARKMVARMRGQGHDVLYYENIEGGHGGAADLEQTIRNSALKYTYFHERLGLGR